MIYLVEDDSNIRELVVYTLCSSGLDTLGFPTPSAFWSAMDRTLPDLILLDVMLPEEDGFSILQKIKSVHRTSSVPVVMLTAKGEEEDKVHGLEMGADDYIAKPFGMKELVARVRARLRASSHTVSTEYQVGPLFVSIARHTVTVDGAPVLLAKKEFEMLCFLLENRGVVLTRDQLLSQIWGYSFDGESRTVDVHIRTLRQKLGTAGDLIETIRGVGYKIGGNES